MNTSYQLSDAMEEDLQYQHTHLRYSLLTHDMWMAKHLCDF